MRPLALLLATLLLAPALARADGQNERMRQAGSHPSGGSSGGRGTSDGGTTSGGSDDWSGLCNCLCSLTDLFFQAGTCAAGPGPGAQPVVVEGPYEVPPAPPEPWKGFVLVGLERVVDGHFLLVPRLEAALDVPLGRRQAFRVGLEHESFLEAQRESAAAPARWDHIPLSTLRLGWVVRPGDWELALVGGMKLLDLGAGMEPGIDGGAVVRGNFGRLSLEAGALVLLFQPVVGLEPWVRAAWAFGPLQVGLGWKHTQFFDAQGPIRYTGPEVSVALRP